MDEDKYITYTDNVKINEQKLYLNWMELRGLLGELHHSSQLPQTRKDILSISIRKMFFFYLAIPSGIRIFSLLGNHSANERL